MRIEANNRSTGVTGRSAAGKAGGGPAFVPSGGESAARVASAAPVAPSAGLEAILALQAVGTATDGRRRSLRRGSMLLDALEDIKADLLIGHIDGARLDALVGELSEMRQRVEPGLDAVLEDIELRVRVELAKLGRFPPF